MDRNIIIIANLFLYSKGNVYFQWKKNMKTLHVHNGTFNDFQCVYVILELNETKQKYRKCKVLKDVNVNAWSMKTKSLASWKVGWSVGRLVVRLVDVKTWTKKKKKKNETKKLPIFVNINEIYMAPTLFLCVCVYVHYNGLDVFIHWNIFFLVSFSFWFFLNILKRDVYNYGFISFYYNI